MKNYIAAATLVTGLLLGYLPTNASAVTISSGAVTVEEFVGENAPWNTSTHSQYLNHYRVTNNSQSTVSFFAVTNTRGWGTSTTQPGWQTEYAGVEWWGNNADQGYISQYGSYESLFGPMKNWEIYVNIYWTTDAATYGIKPGEIADKFRFNAPFASEFVTWDENKQIISQSYQAPVAPSTVPEPGALTLVGLAIAGLMAARYRKQA
ncbi:MAG: PEP-CTERM sorting domain-containing protein [Azonexus sp.]